MKFFYQMTKEDVFHKVESSDNGLTSQEAKERLSEDGKNILKEKNRKSAVKIFFSQFSNMMILLLILVGCVSLVHALVNNESLIEPIVIFSCIIVNAIMGFVQEMNSEKTT